MSLLRLLTLSTRPCLRPLLAIGLLGGAAASCLAGFGLDLGDSKQSSDETQANTLSQSGGSSAPVGRVVAANHLPVESACTSGQPAPRTLRRLTQSEHQATIADLFNGATDLPQNRSLFAQEPSAYGFFNMQANLVINRNNIVDVQASAEAAGAYAKAHLELVGSCQTFDASCMQQVVGQWGRRAFRRPLTDREISDYRDLMGGCGDYPHAAEALVAATLQSPHFLYRAEMGQLSNRGDYTLTQHEIATELSYLFTGSMPDAALASAADQKALGTSTQIAQQAARLWQGPRARPTVSTFLLQWLGVSDLARQVHTERDGVTLSDEVKTAMLAQTRAFVEQVAFDQNGSYADLLGRNAALNDEGLTAFYGGSAADRLPGVLGLGSWLAAASSAIEASPVLRGRALRMRFLCQSIGSPPSNVPTTVAQGPTATTLRQRFVAHTAVPACLGCHNLMDPLAYPLGNYDGLGRRRKDDCEDGTPVDMAGHVYAPAAGDEVDLAGGAALAAYLAHSPQAQACLSRHLGMYAFGQLSWSQDGCTFAAAANYAAPSGYNLQQVFIGLTQTPSFTTRVQDP